MHGMTTAGDQRRDAVGHESCHPECRRGKAGVVRAGQGQNGAGERGKQVPDRLLGARPTQPEARRQTGRGVAETFRAPRPIARGESFEHGAVQPGIDETLDIAGGLELLRQAVVGLTPALACAWILNAPGHADEDETAQRQIRTKRHMQRHAGTQRVAKQRARPAAHDRPCCLRHEYRSRRQVGAHRPGVAVAGQIHGDQCVRFGQEVSEAAPEAPGLGESVQQEQRRTRTAHFCMECHVG